MHIDVLAVVPELLSGPFDHSILKRARERDLLTIEVHDLKHYGIGKFKHIDDYQYGGGAGMVLRVEPLFDAIEALTKQRTYDEIIFLTPDAPAFDQGVANELSMKENLLLVCGHYKGIDQRVRDRLITREISIGDYVLSGGELAASIVVDAIGRLIPGVLNDETSALSDSFQDGLLSCPVYTRPAVYRDMKVPDILLSGHEARIEEWRHEQAIKKTKEVRSDLLD
jgi:tRNA (guanine37-N1)-methyltransferase